VGLAETISIKKSGQKSKVSFAGFIVTHYTIDTSTCLWHTNPFDIHVALRLRVTDSYTVGGSAK
jgi:hypothetical protein